MNKKIMKRFIALIMAFILCIPTTNLGAHAEDQVDDTGKINLLSDEQEGESQYQLDLSYARVIEDTQLDFNASFDSEMFVSDSIAVKPELKDKDGNLVTGDLYYQLNYDGEHNYVKLFDNLDNDDDLGLIVDGGYLDTSSPNDYFILKRFSKEGTEVTVTAQIYDEENDEWETLATETITLEALVFDIDFAEGNIRGNGYTWVFSDETLVINPISDALTYDSAQNVSLNWEYKLTAHYKDNDEDFEVLYSGWEKNDEGLLLIYGSILKNRVDFDDYYCNVLVNLYAGNILVAEAEFGLGVEEPYTNYNCPEIGGTYVTGTNFWIKNFDCEYKNSDEPNGCSQEIIITNVTVKNVYPEDEAPICQVIDHEDSWEVVCSRNGHAQITYYYDDIKDEKQQKTFDVWVVSDAYYIDYTYECDNCNMQPDSTADITTSLRYEWNHGDGDCGSKIIEDYYIDFLDDNSYDIDLIECEIDEDGKTLIVNSGSSIGESTIELVAYLTGDEDEGDPVSGCSIYVNVSADYYYIDDLYYDHRLLVGDSLTPENSFDENPNSPVLVREYINDDGNPDRDFPVENIRYRIEYDEAVLKITDADGTIIPNGGATECEGSAYTFLRKSPEYTEFNIIAEQLGDDGETWNELCKRKFTFYDLGYETGFNNLRGDNDYTWVYTGENDYEVGVWTNVTWDGYAEGALEYCWEVVSYSFNDNTGASRTLIKDGYTVDEDGTIILDGDSLKNAFDPNERFLRAELTIKANGYPAAEAGFGFEVREPRADYYYPVGDGEYLLGTVLEIQSFECNYENPYAPDGDWMYCSISNVTVENKYPDTNKDVCEVHCNDDGDTWQIECINFGQAVATIEYYNVYYEIESYQFNITVSPDIYTIEYDYPHDTDCMLANGEMTIGTKLRHDWNYGNKKCGSEYVENYNINYLYDNEDNKCYDPNLFDVVIPTGSKTVSVESTGKIGDGNIGIQAFIEELGYVAETFIHVNVTDCYYYIDDVEYDSHLLIGKCIEIEPSVLEANIYNNENETAAPGGTIRYRVEYDEKCLTVIDVNGEVITDGGSTESEDYIYTILRHGCWGTAVTLIAEQLNENYEWRELCRRDFWFDHLDYYVEFSNLHNDRYTWIYDHELAEIGIDSKIFEDYMLDELDIIWNPVFIRMDDESENKVKEALPCGYEISDDGKSIKISGSDLCSWINENNIDPNDIIFSCELVIKLKNTDIVIAEDSFDFDAREPFARYDYPVVSDVYYVLGASFDINHIQCYYENAEYPYGNWTEIPINYVELIDDGICDFDNNQDGTFTIFCDKLGVTEITVYYDDYLTDRGTFFKFKVHVQPEVYYIEYDYPENTDCMLPGSFMYIPTRLLHEWNNGEGDCGYEYIEDYTLVIGSDEEGTPYYDTDLIDVIIDEYDSQGLKVYSGENYGDCNIAVYAYMDDPDEELTWALIKINVCDCYYYFESDDYDPGILLNESTVLLPEIIKAYLDEDGDVVSEYPDAEIRYRIEYDENCLLVTDANENVVPSGEATECRNNRHDVLRIGAWGTSITIIAEILDEDGENWNEVCRRNVQFDNLDYSLNPTDLRIEDEGMTWVYSNCNLTVDLENNFVDIYGANNITWKAYVYEGESFSDIYEGNGYTVGKNGSITFDGAKLQAQLTNPEENVYYDVAVSAYSGDSLIAQTHYGLLVFVCEHEEDDIVIDAAENATCTTDGKTEGSHCAECGEVIVAQQTVAAKGHTLAETAAKAATCTEPGNTAYYTCSVCGKYFSDAKGKTEIAKNSWVVAAKGHTTVIDAAVAATCTETGLTEGKHCGVCGEVIIKQEVVPELLPGAKNFAFSIANASGGVNISWNKNSAASGYEILRSDDNGKTWKLYKTISGNSTVSYLDTGVTNGKTYRYSVRPYAVVGGKTYRPSYPTSKAILYLAELAFSVANASGSVKVSWNKNAAATGYEVLRWDEIGKTWKMVKSINNNATLSYVDTAVTNGKMYRYSVRPYYTANGTTTRAPYPTSKAIVYLTGQNFTVANKGIYIDLTWDKNAAATGYEILRSDDNGATWKTYKTITSNATLAFTDTSVVTGKTYKYSVRPYKTVDGVTYRASWPTSKMLVCLKISTFSVANTSKGIKISWNQNTAATGYDILRTDDGGKTWKLYKSISGNATTSYIDTAVTKGKTYSYSVRAIKVVGSTTYRASYATSKSITCTMK